MADQTVNRTAQMMYENALNHLSNGILTPIDKNVLSYAPLPSDVIDPYISQHVDALQTMDMTNNALTAWIEESKKASYFTKHFVTLSRMIMSGVATMARGLVTLHMKGEDLDQAPMSIGDLISVSSYQFRKSYLGVLQTVKKNPGLSEDLLMNQLGWNNTLLKLFKTKDKLSKPVVVQQNTQCLEAEAAAPVVPALGSGAEIETSAGGSGSDAGAKELKELPALSEPGSYGAIRAYAPYKGNAERGIRNDGNEEVIMKHEGTGFGLDDENTEKSIKQEEERPDRDEENDEVRMKHEGTGSGLSGENTVKSIKHEGERPDRNDGNEEVRMKHEGTGSGLGDENTAKSIKHEEERPDRNDGNEEGRCQNEDEEPGKADGFGVRPLDPEHPPEFLKILYRALCRSSGSEDGTVAYTVEEVQALLADPEFCYYKPELAAEMREFLDSIDEKI